VSGSGVSVFVDRSAGEKSARTSKSPFANVDKVRLPDSRTGTVVGVWNFGEAYQIDVGGTHEIWAADDLAAAPQGI
jgi:hypothetical protein